MTRPGTKTQRIRVGDRVRLASATELARRGLDFTPGDFPLERGQVVGVERRGRIITVQVDHAIVKTIAMTASGKSAGNKWRCSVAKKFYDVSFVELGHHRYFVVFDVRFGGTVARFTRYDEAKYYADSLNKSWEF